MSAGRGRSTAPLIRASRRADRAPPAGPCRRTLNVPSHVIRAIRVSLASWPRSVASRAPLAAQDSDARCTRCRRSRSTVSSQVYYRAGDPLTKDGFRPSQGRPQVQRRHLAAPAVARRVRRRQGARRQQDRGQGRRFDAPERRVDRSEVAHSPGRGAHLHSSTDVQRRRRPADRAARASRATIPTSQVETVERANFIVERSRAVGLGDVRDIGVSANGTRRAICSNITLGVFNEPGDAQGTTDANEQKTVIGRLRRAPCRSCRTCSSADRERTRAVRITQHRERAGGELQYQDRDFTLRGEAMSARDGLAAPLWLVRPRRRAPDAAPPTRRALRLLGPRPPRRSLGQRRVRAPDRPRRQLSRSTEPACQVRPERRPPNLSQHHHACARAPSCSRHFRGSGRRSV